MNHQQSLSAYISQQIGTTSWTLTTPRTAHGNRQSFSRRLTLQEFDRLKRAYLQRIILADL